MLAVTLHKTNGTWATGTSIPAVRGHCPYLIIVKTNKYIDYEKDIHFCTLCVPFMCQRPCAGRTRRRRRRKRGRRRLQLCHRRYQQHRLVAVIGHYKRFKPDLHIDRG